jgi:hypothetical protein
VSIVIPTWLLWIFGGVVLLALLFLAFWGAVFIKLSNSWEKR